MNIIEVILTGLVLLALFIAYQAHKNHVTFAAQAAADKDNLKQDLHNLELKAQDELHALELRLSRSAPPTAGTSSAGAPPAAPAAGG